MISPQLFLILLLALTGGAFLVHSAVNLRCRAGLRKLAAERQMQYADGDLFNLARRVEAHWPIPDCSEWRVIDLIYGTVGSEHRYIFTVHFTLGPLDRYRRDVRVATCCEPCEGCGYATLSPQLAEPRGGRVEQYRALMGMG